MRHSSMCWLMRVESCVPSWQLQMGHTADSGWAGVLAIVAAVSDRVVVALLVEDDVVVDEGVVVDVVVVEVGSAD